MSRSLRLYLLGFVGFLFTIWLLWPGQALFESPEQTYRYLKTQLAEHNWSNLYHTLHPDYKNRLTPRLRAGLQFASEQLPTELELNRLDIQRMSDQEIFSLYLKSMQQDPEWKKKLNAFLQTEISEKIKSDSNAVILKLTPVKDFELTRLFLRQKDQQWKLYKVDQNSGGKQTQ